MDAILPSQPETYRQLIRRSILLYRLSFKKVFLFALLLSLTVFIPRLVSNAVGHPIFNDLTAFNPKNLWIMAINLVGLIFFIAIIWHMHCVIVGQHEPMVQDVEMGLKKIFYVFVAGIIQSLILFGVILVAYGFQWLIPTIHPYLGQDIFSVLFLTLIFFSQLFLILYVAVLFIFVVPIIAIENKGIISALERSVLLGWNHSLRIFLLQMVPWCSLVLFFVLLKLILGVDVHIYFYDQAMHPFWVTILQWFIFALFIPWDAAMLLVQLKDLELRKHIVA